MLALVVIVNVAFPELPAMDGGLNSQSAPLGKPEHESVAAVLNPKLERAFIVDVAEFPAVNGAGDRVPAVSSKPVGVVLRITPRPPTLNVTDPARFQKKTMSVRPSPFISA